MASQFTANHQSYRKHRRQTWLHIYLPLLLAGGVGIALAVVIGLAAFGESGDSQRWAAISTIWLLFPLLFLGLLFLVVVLAACYLLARALKFIPPYTAKAQSYVSRATRQVKRASDLAVRPVLFVQGIVASLGAIWGRK